MAIYQSVLIDVYAAPLNRIARSTTHDWPIFACPNSEWKKRIVGKKLLTIIDLHVFAIKKTTTNKQPNNMQQMEGEAREREREQLQ